MLVAAGLCLASPGAMAAEAPASLVITYRVAPADRAAFLDALKGKVLPQWAAWRREGALRSFRLYASRHADVRGVDALAVVTFVSLEQSAAWARIERHHPAGLAPEVLKSVQAIETAPADRARHEGPEEGASPRGVTLAIPYNVLVGRADYFAYVDAYVLPQVRGWIEDGALASADLMQARYPAGRPWSAMLLLTYSGEAGLDRREAVVARVRERLREDPAWRAASETKAKIRDELPPIVLDIIGEAGP